jgi:NDP-sugar pyrophosphorylase family protein
MAGQATKAIILAGGRGTRLHPFSFTIPKPLMPIGQEPILLHLIKRLRRSGINDILLALGYQSELIQAYFGTGERFQVRIRYFQEQRPLGTAGPLKLMQDCFEPGEYFFLINGDVYCEMDFAEMGSFAVEGGYELVVGFVERIERSPYGVLDIRDHAVQQIIEKPERRSHISAGIYVVNQRVLDLIPQDEFFTMPDVMGAYLASGRTIGAFPIRAFWLGIEDVENMDEVVNRLESVGRPED